MDGKNKDNFKIKLTEEHTDVLNFHLLAGHPISNKVKMISKERALQRIAYMEEELEEYRQAIKKGDIVEALDALVDLKYFILGTEIEHGFHLLGKLPFEIVQHSNMSKFPLDLKTAQETQKVQNNLGVKTYIEKTETFNGSKRYVIKRLDTDKVVKGLDFRDPEENLNDLIYKFNEKL